MTAMRPSVFLLIAATVALCAAPVFAENLVFPSGSGVINITQSPYNADRTGRTDVSTAFNTALEAARALNYYSKNIVYVPNGTYLVTNTIHWKFPINTTGPHMVGQSKAGVVFRLKDGTWPLGTEAKAVIQTGQGVAQNFNRGLMNVTVNIGRNNDGAYGVYWFGNNEALMSDVDIVSMDGKGLVGLYLGAGEQGPSMARRVKITGFRTGIWSQSLCSITLSEITLLNQSELGIYNELHPMWIDSLYSVNTVEAVYNHNRGAMVLINARLTGGSNTSPAIRNIAGGRVFLRNITTTGYMRALYCPSTLSLSPPSGANIDEFTSHGSVSLFPSGASSLNLPRKRAPDVAWEQDMNKWANIESYAGSNAGQKLQAAVNDQTKTTVVLPGKDKGFTINQDVTVGANITRIICTGGSVSGTGAIIVTGGTTPIIFQKIASMGSGTSLRLIQRSSRPVVFESVSCPVKVEGSGDVFITDIVSECEVNHANAHLWAWQFNAECCNTWSAGQVQNLVVRQGTAWIFGWKDEHTGTAATLTGGRTEILGYLQQCASLDKTGIPLFLVTNADVSIASVTQTNFGEVTNLYELLVKETQGSTIRQLMSTAATGASQTLNPNQQQWQVPLFTSYDPVRAQERALEGRQIAGDHGVAARTIANRIVVSAGDRFAQVTVVDSRGRAISTSISSGLATSGTLTPGTYFVRVVTEVHASSHAVVVAR